MKLDLNYAFRHLKIYESSWRNTIFTAKNRQYFFIFYLFGLKQVSSAFQRIMSFMFNKAPNVTAFVYGVFNYSSNIENHLVNVQDASSDSLKSI